ncbi:Alpha/Beta hydrolase protein [Aspergillus falconensis]
MISCLLLVVVFVVNARGLGPPRGFSGPVYSTLDSEEPQALLSQSPHRYRLSAYRRVVNEKTSLTFLYQNDLNSTDDQNHAGAILLGPLGQHDLRDACEEIGETMISFSTITEYRQDFLHLFSYYFYTRNQTGEAEHEHAKFYIQNGVLSLTAGENQLDHQPFPSQNIPLPVLCTQTNNDDNQRRGGVVQRQLIRVNSENNMYIGSRDQKSFRFLGIPYAEPPTRFSYARPYSGKFRTIQATEYRSSCAQVAGGSEDCLYLNIQTPYIPKKNSTAGLRPVLFWIHGGNFTAGAGSDPATDGGNLASREDIVVVTFNYRLSTLGFLAVPGTDIRGNYGIADQVLALEWTAKNIAQFGGDPRRITIIGEGAGARSVKALLGSPLALGKFQGAIAMSDVRSGVGIEYEDGGASYNSYLSPLESYQTAGQKIFSEVGCNQGSTEQQISCLRELPVSTLVNLPTIARYIVQDGKYVNATDLNLIEKHAGTAHVPVIFGNVAHEGASFISYPSNNMESELEGIQESLNLSTTQALRIRDSNLFPSPNTGNLTLDSFSVAQRIATDTKVRCPNQAALYAGVCSGVFQASYYYQMQRTIGGNDPNNLGRPPSSSEYPNGDPDLPYFRLHGSDPTFVFGNLDTIRDPLDLYAAQLISTYFAEFVRSGQPNPDVNYLAARGYQRTLDAVQAFGPWEPVRNSSGPIHMLDFPSEKASFQDLEQCEFLGLPIMSYLDQANLLPSV